MSTVRQRPGRGGANGPAASAPAPADDAKTKGSVRVGGVNVFKALGLIMLAGLLGTVVRYVQDKDKNKEHLAWTRMKRDSVSGLAVYIWDSEGEFTPAEQLAAIVDKNEPTVIVNAPPAAWKALKAWNPAYIAETVPELPHVRRKKDSPVFLNENLNSLAEKALEAGVGHAPTEEVLASLATKEFWAPAGEDGTYEYFAGSILDASFEALRRDLAPQNESAAAELFGMEALSAGLSLEDCFLWLARPGIQAGLHYDTTHNINVQIMGEKRFTLAPPIEWSHAQLYPSFHVSARQSRLEPPYAAVHDKQKVTLKPGQALFIPAYTLHAAESVGETANVNFFSTSRLRRGHKSWLEYDKIAPPELRRLIRSDPIEYPKTLATFVLGFVLAAKNHVCSKPNSFKYGFDTIPAYIEGIVKKRFGHDWAAYGCGDWDPSQCPNLYQDVGSMPAELRSAFGAIFAENLKVFKNEPCGPLTSVLDFFLADWWEATVSAGVGFDRMCNFLRCLTIPQGEA